MDLGVIAPISFMEEVAKLSKTSMYLYHLFDNSKYEERFFEDSNFRIMDNGVFELSSLPSNEEYIAKILRLCPEEIIAPDVPHNTLKTLKKTNCFIEENFSLLKNISIQAVVQAKTFNDALNCYKEYSENPAISTIGFPFMMELEDVGYGRKDLIKYLLNKGDWNFQKEAHLLGLKSLEEIIEISRLGIIRSCDSSKFYRHAEQEFSYIDQLPYGDFNEPLNFKGGGNEKCLGLLKKNLGVLINKISG